MIKNVNLDTSIYLLTYLLPSFLTYLARERWRSRKKSQQETERENQKTERKNQEELAKERKKNQELGWKKYKGTNPQSEATPEGRHLGD